MMILMSNLINICIFLSKLYSAIRESYDAIFREGDDLSVTLKRTHRMLSSYVYALFIH